MSIVLVVFPGAPRPCSEAKQADEELEANLKKIIKGCFHFKKLNTD